MTKSLLAMFALGAVALSVSCAGLPSPSTPTATQEETTPVSIATPVTMFPTNVAGAVATPPAITTPVPATATVFYYTPTPTATVVVGTPTPTPTLGPSASLLREAAALQDQVDAFREAVAASDKDAALKAQRALLDALPAADAAAGNDTSKAAESFRAGLRDLRAALNGDLAKLESAAKGISQVSGITATRTQTPGALAQNTAQAVASSPKFAQEVANRIAAFQKAQDQGNIADILRLQKSLIDDVDRGQSALKNLHTKDADTIRGALEDLANALSGDSIKFDSAATKLAQVGGSTASDTSKPTAVANKPVDLQPVANELLNRLTAYQNAIDGNNKDDIAQAAKALADQVAKAQDATKNDQSAKATKLREAFGPAREAAGGDQSKIDAAKNALDPLAR